MTCTPAEVTNLFYTVARGWISQTDLSLCMEFERTHSFSSIAGGILSSIQSNVDDEVFANGHHRLVQITSEYRVTPMASTPDKFKASEIDDTAYMATSHFFSALGRAFGLGPLFFVPFYNAVSFMMENYYRAELIAATTGGHS